jgi:hypothetical protein
MVGRRPCPRCGSTFGLSQKREGGRAHLRPQRALILAPQLDFRQFCSDLWLAKEGGDNGCGHRDRASRGRSLVGAGQAPVGAVLLANGKRRRVHCCPQRARIPDPRHFCLQTAPSWGPLKGAVMPMVDPSARHPPRLGRAGPGPDGGRGSCRRWGGTSRVRQKPDEPISAPKGAPFTHRRCFA